MAQPPEVSNNPRYYSTGAKLDIRKSECKYKDGLNWEQRKKSWAREKALREGVKPTDKDLALLHTLHAKIDNAVVEAIWQWYDNHGCVKLSQLTYLRGLAAQLS